MTISARFTRCYRQFNSAFSALILSIAVAVIPSQVRAGHDAGVYFDVTSAVVEQGQAATYTGKVTVFSSSCAGVTTSVSVSSRSLPPGVTWTVSPVESVETEYPVILRVEVPSDLPVGSYNLFGNVAVDGGCYGNGFSLQMQVTELKEQKVTIDIKPGSEDNAVNIYSAGVIPVAILSSAEFDAPAMVDPETVALAGASVKLVGKSGKYLCHAEDVNGDGLDDLICKVYTAGFMIEEGASTAIMEAKTYEGLLLRGEDTVKITP